MPKAPSIPPPMNQGGDDKDIRIAQLEWALAVLTLKYQEAESEATVILPRRSLGVYSAFDVTLTEGDDHATVVTVRVRR